MMQARLQEPNIAHSSNKTVSEIIYRGEFMMLEEPLPPETLNERLQTLFLVAESSKPESISAAVQLKANLKCQALKSNVSASLSARVIETCNDRLSNCISGDILAAVLQAAGLPPGYRCSAPPKNFSVGAALNRDPTFRILLERSEEAKTICGKASRAVQACAQAKQRLAAQGPGCHESQAAARLAGAANASARNSLAVQQQNQPLWSSTRGGPAAAAPAAPPSACPVAAPACSSGRGFKPPVLQHGQGQGQAEPSSVRQPQRQQEQGKPCQWLHNGGGGPNPDGLLPAEGSSRWGEQEEGGRRWAHPHGAKRPAGAPASRAGHQDDDLEGTPLADEGPRATPGFKSAKTQLAIDLAKKGQSYNSLYNNNSQTAPRAGLQRPQKRQAVGGGRGNGACAKGGYVPPFVQKALDGPGENESPYSESTLALLAGPDGQVPEEIQKLDPKIVDQVCNEILDSSGSVAWEDIAGQERAKQLVQEIVVWPMLNPQLFTGTRSPPRGLLLFGPPGTGKTLIGKAIASNMSATFFSISSSSLTSKWIGEGEKMVKALFTVARCLQPSVIFIDEIDSILTARKSEGEHESSRRLKTEMLVQMEGCDPKSSGCRVLLIGATNRPEELDDAARRRLPKQLYISLPCAAARRQMVLRMLSGVRHSLSEVEVDKVVARTEGYSGSDMRNYIQEACQGPIREAQRRGQQLQGLTETDLKPVALRDFQLAQRAQKRSVADEEVLRYEEYNEKHGAKYAEAGDENEVLDEW